jgi:drug/metabolite transporter (DMT)-like permease
MAVGTGLSAAVGYAILNIAAAKVVKEGVAIPSAIVSSALNAIFHSLYVQRAQMPQSCMDMPLLMLFMLAAILSTGYIYASSEESVEQTLSKSNNINVPIALMYQASYFLPIGFVLNELIPAVGAALTAKLRSHFCLKPNSGDIESLLDNAETRVDANSSIQQNLEILKAILINTVAYGLGVAMIYVSASAAYQLFHKDEDPSVISRMYRPIYGDAFYASFLAHLPMLPLAGESAKDGIISGAICIMDLLEKSSLEKAAVAGMSLLILGLTSVTLFLIASYGEVGMAALLLSLMGAGLGNVVPAIKCSQAIVTLPARRQAKAALECILSKENPMSFFSVLKAENNNKVEGLSLV